MKLVVARMWRYGDYLMKLEWRKGAKMVVIYLDNLVILIDLLN